MYLCVFCLKQQDDSGGALSEIVGSHAAFKTKVCMKNIYSNTYSHTLLNKTQFFMFSG